MWNEGPILFQYVGVLLVEHNVLGITASLVNIFTDLLKILLVF